MLGNTPERRYLHSHWTDILSVFNKVIRHVNDTNWSCSGVFWFHVFGCSLEVSFVSNVESIPRTELGRLARFLSMAYLAHVVTSKYDLRNCFFFVSASKDCCIYSSFLCCHLHWDLPQRKTNQRNMNLLWITFEDFAKLCRFYFRYGIWDWNRNSLSGNHWEVLLE